ncbi:hypothetical protein BH23ACT6_BH23ACT6_19130 [soil metagenome]
MVTPEERGAVTLRRRLTWVVAIAAVITVAALIVLALAQSSRQPGQQSELAQRFTSGDQQTTSSGSVDRAADGSDGTWGLTDGASTLVLYDATGSQEEVEDAETYAIVAGNLATHFGRVTARPMADYTAAMMRQYDGVVYVGSSDRQEIPRPFYDDMIGGQTPVLWTGANVSDLERGNASLAARFEQNYGWDPTGMSTTGRRPISGIAYNGKELTRQGQRSGPINLPQITDDERVEVLATTTEGDPQPWAIRSDNLTYIGEVPLISVDESDRYLAFADLLYDLLAPDTEESQQAAIRLEDVDAGADPLELRAVADYLHSKDIPFQVAVVPARIAKTDDPDSSDRIGLGLSDNPEVVAALEYMTERGGTLIQHGTTHQFVRLNNPYDGTSGADFEFFRAQCSSTPDKPYDIEPCEDDSYVVTTGPVGPDDVAQWVKRLEDGRELFADAGLARPTIFQTPHYAASSNAYLAMDEVYDTRYERSLYFPGLLSGTEPQLDKGAVQYFPYRVHDFYGSTVLPENLGIVTQNEQIGNAIRDAQPIIDHAEKNLVVRESTASFSYDPSLGTDPLREIVEGIEGLGYTFVPATELK